MLRHWLVKNGTKVTDQTVYIKTSDSVSDSQLDQVIDGIRELGWDLNNVFVLEKATTSEYQHLSKFIKKHL